MEYNKPKRHNKIGTKMQEKYKNRAQQNKKTSQ
jgi:hypothetical protein